MTNVKFGFNERLSIIIDMVYKKQGVKPCFCLYCFLL